MLKQAENNCQMKLKLYKDISKVKEYMNIGTVILCFIIYMLENDRKRKFTEFMCTGFFGIYLILHRIWDQYIGLYIKFEGNIGKNLFRLIMISSFSNATHENR